jgi:hypothetical protein
MVMKIKVEFFEVVIPCNVVVGYQRFRVKMEVARPSEMLVSYYKTTLHHNPEETDLKNVFVTNLHITCQ